MANRPRLRFPGAILMAVACAGGAWAQQMGMSTGNSGGDLVQALGTASSLLAGKPAAELSGGLMAVPEDFSRLAMAPGFLLNVQVYDTPELSGEYRIDNKGDIILPLAGSIHVAGRTLPEAQHAIEQKLLTGEILNHPQVSINVEQYAPFIVAVIGEVQTPGRVQLLAPHSLLDILSQVGGETPLAGDIVEIRHLVDGQEKTDTYHYNRQSDGASIRNVMVANGDTVIVPRAGIVYVLGAVNRPGGYVMQEDGRLDVAQALSLASGTMIQAKVKDTRILRRNADGTWVMIPVNYRKLTDGHEVPLQLHAQDIVYVPMSKVKSVFTSGSALVGEMGSATIYSVR